MFRFVYEAWGYDGAATVISTPENLIDMQKNGLLDPKERPLFSIKGTWDEAMQFYNDFNGYGPYIPMKD